MNKDMKQFLVGDVIHLPNLILDLSCFIVMAVDDEDSSVRLNDFKHENSRWFTTAYLFDLLSYNGVHVRYEKTPYIPSTEEFFKIQPVINSKVLFSSYQGIAMTKYQFVDNVDKPCLACGNFCVTSCPVYNLSTVVSAVDRKYLTQYKRLSDDSVDLQ